jgi:acyclic terpene utilization AtuA family protein
MPGVSVLCASGSLGLTPMHHESYWAAVESKPDAIVADAGSGDIGPSYLGSGAPYSPREWEKHDLRLMLVAARRLGVPMIVGSAGGAGTNGSVDSYADLVAEIAAEEGLGGFRLARIYAEVDIEDLARRAREERIEALGAGEALRPEDVEACSRVVAMMGVEPLVAALDAGAEVIVAGRSCDDAIFAAVPIHAGCDRALSLHMGKTIECGPLVATPILMREAIMATVREHDFLVEPFHPEQACTPASVAGHTLYERLDPNLLDVPGGSVDLHAAVFEPHTDRVCRVAGARWIPADEYRVKLEGSAFVGHRVFFLFGLRDPLSIANVDRICDGIAVEVERQFGPPSDASHRLFFHVYGRDAIMGEREPTPEIRSHEICVVIEAVAPDSERAVNVAKLAKYASLRVHYPGKLGTAGGCAMLADEVLLSPHPTYRWAIDHLLPLADPLELFALELAEVPELAPV